jgi:hypothetical protein
MLGLAELKPIVKRAFVRDLVSAGSLDYGDFEENLQKGIDDPGAPLRQPHGEYALFGDAIEEFSTWECYRPADPPPEADPAPPEKSNGVLRWFPPDSTAPAVNPYRNIGRNAPCPCGSGRKFKKCCLPETQGLIYGRRRR